MGLVLMALGGRRGAIAGIDLWLVLVWESGISLVCYYDFDVAILVFVILRL